MEQRVVLRTTLLALEETVRALAEDRSKPSPALVKQINSVLSDINQLVPGSHFATFDSYPHTIEVLRQIKLAIGLVGQDPPNSTEDQIPSTQFSTDEIMIGEVRFGESTQVNSQGSKPEIFIGCSVEGLTEAKIIQMELAHSASTVIWSQGVFGLSRGTLETLVEKAPSFTHAILVLTPDDMLTKRDSEAPTARDNVLFELGLFMGALGRQRTFVVTEKSVALPSDLAGIATVSFQRGEGINVVANMGPVVTRLQLEMGLL